VLLSLVAHVGALAGGLMLVGIATPPVLFVDLVHGLLGDEPVATAPVEHPRRSASSARATQAPPGHVTVPGPEPMVASEPLPATSQAGRATSSATPSMPEPVQTPNELPRPAPSSAPPSTVTAPEPVAPATVDGVAASGSGAASLPANRPDAGAGPSAPSNRDGSGGGGGTAVGRAPAPGGREGTGLTLALPGAGGGDGAADALYAELRRRLEQALIYPPAARRRRLTGVVEIELEIQPSGAITRVALAASSSHRILDDAALDTVRGLDRVPFPPGIRPRTLRVRLPVEFALR
jgi:protein TonB